MNINNIFGGVLGFLISFGMLYIFWSPVNTLLDGISDSNTELKIFLGVSWVAFGFILGVIAPINLATSDDKGVQ